MAAQTGRTTYKNVAFKFDNAAGTITAIPELFGLSACGLAYDEQDVTAWADAVKNVLPAMPSAPITARFRFSTTAMTHLTGVLGDSIAHSLDIQFGVRHAWEAGEPQFGITNDGVSGYTLTSLMLNPDDMTLEAKFECIGGLTAPAFGTAAES